VGSPTLESPPVVLTSLPFSETLVIPGGAVNQAVWLGEEGALALATSKGLYLLESLNAEPLIRDAGSPMASVASRTEDERVAAGGLDSLIRIWDGLEGSFLDRWSGHLLGVVRLYYPPSGNFLASASDDATVRIWNEAGSTLQLLRGPITRVVDLAVSPSGLLVAAASEQHVHIWNPYSGEVLEVLSQPSGWYQAVAFSPNSQRLVTAYDGRRLDFRDTLSWERVDVMDLAGAVADLAYSPDGRLLAVAYQDGRIQLRDPFSGYLLADLPGHPEIRSLTFHSETDLMLTSSADGSVRIWDLGPLVDE
jgi:WD40 repeat protein